LIWVLVCAAISVLWGTEIAHTKSAWLDFRAVYAGTRCLIHGHNPYNVSDLEREYLSEDGQRPTTPPTAFRSITLYVNVPPAFIFVAPFAALPWAAATLLWMLVTGTALIAGLLLMWCVGARSSVHVSTFLACILAVNCESIFAGGNTAGIVVGLCGIAVWCFLENRWATIGVVCLAMGLAVKPHDAGLVWLYFVLAGGVNRKRALASGAITAAMGAVALVWLWHVAPHWIEDWRANLAAISAHGGINEPGPNARTDTIFSIVDLQAALSIFKDAPGFYNPATYLVCGALIAAWSVKALWGKFTEHMAWLALAAATAFTMLITYHRVWDAKLVMIAIPACCVLWAEGGKVGKVAVLITSIAALLTGDLSLTTYYVMLGGVHVNPYWFLAPAINVVLLRPASLALLAMAIFYLWVDWRGVPVNGEDAVKPGLGAGTVRASS
jgi:hypothetical protein